MEEPDEYLPDIEESIRSETNCLAHCLGKYKPTIHEDYIPKSEDTEELWNEVSKTTPEAQMTNSDSMNELYRCLSEASKLPTFSGLSHLALFLSIKEIKNINPELLLLSLATLLSFNPALSWWLLSQGSASVVQLTYQAIRLSVLHPSKAMILYATYKKSKDIREFFKIVRNKG